MGEVLARGVSDGPDDDRDNILNVILGALSCAESSVVLVTPYFLPVSVVTSIWGWMLDSSFGILQYPIEAIWGEPVPVFATRDGSAWRDEVKGIIWHNSYNPVLDRVWLDE